jgi:hypothetical protein
MTKSREHKIVVFRGVIRPKLSPVLSNSRVVFDESRDTDRPTYYSILSQSRVEVEIIDNSPSVSMWPYLLASAQTERMNEISVYTERGMTADKLRFLYMNDFALALWTEMGKDAKVMGRLHRPPRGAAWSFGTPFSE